MLHFDSDYMRGAHPEVMRRIMECNLEQTPGYGSDEYTARASALILEACGLEEKESKVVFLVGGTQTNATIIDSFIPRRMGVLCTTTAHINVHEAGAVEYTGHKVLTLPSHEGKLSADDVRRYVSEFYADDSCKHMVAPGMAYISYPTELGTLYSRSELEDLSLVCHENGMILYLDGARLGYGLASDACDLTMKDIASLCDVFYFGGTKCGTLFGEAVVVKEASRWKNSITEVKQHGALLAKGRLLGLQFATLFTDGLYLKISRNAVEKAMKLREGFLAAGIKLYMDSPTNQQFFILPNELLDVLMQKASFELWGPRAETQTPVRFVTDWATSDEEINNLLSALYGFFR